MLRAAVGGLILLALFLLVILVSYFWFVVGPVIVLAFFLVLAWFIGDLVLDW